MRNQAISAIRLGYRFAGMLPSEVGSEYVRTLAQCWRERDSEGARVTLESLAYEASQVDGLSGRLPELERAIEALARP